MFVNCEDTFFMNLIPRLYDVCGGAVKIAGVDVRDFDLTYLREQTGVVTQYLINLRRTASESGAQFQAITKSIAWCHRQEADCNGKYRQGNSSMHE